MTYLDERDDIIQYCLITLFSLATIGVLLYLLFASPFTAYLALGLYAISFLFLFVMTIRKLIVIKSYKDQLDNFEKNSKPEDLDETFYSKKEKVGKLIAQHTIKEAIKCACSAIFAIFTIVVIVLF